MGHYDDCYEATDREYRKKREEEIKLEFQDKIKKLTVDQKEFLTTIMEDIKDWMIFVKVIKSLKNE
jgi:hypothetical protein